MAGKPPDSLSLKKRISRLLTYMTYRTPLTANNAKRISRKRYRLTIKAAAFY